MNPFYPRFWPEQLADVQYCRTGKGTKPRGIFVCSMSDLFGIGVPVEWTRWVLEAIRADSIDRFYILTKQPQRLAEFSPFPDNCWVGVSVTNYTQYREANNYISPIKAKAKFISFEPLLTNMPSEGLINHVQWAIIGAQSGPTVLPKIEWVEPIVREATQAGVRVWIKKNLLPMLNKHYPNTEFAYRSGKLRQELPEAI